MENQNNKQNLTALLLISLLMGCLFDLLFYAKSLGISFPLYVIAILLGANHLLGGVHNKLTQTSLWLIGSLAFFASMVAVRSSGLLTFFNVAISIFILLLLAKHIVGAKIRQLSVAGYIGSLGLPVTFLQASPQAIGSIQAISKNSTASNIARGILITIPFLVFFSILFSSADTVFKKMVSGIFDLEILRSSDIFFRLFMIGFAALFFAGAYFYLVNKKDSASAHQSQETGISKYNEIETGILMGSLNALFILFIAIQITYLFGGQSNITAQGLTYAEYARKGFFELIVVAVTSFLIIWAHKKLIFETGRKTLLFKALSLTLILEVIVILVSAFTRLSLYEQAYGLTSFRFYSYSFIIWLAAILLLLSYIIAANKKEHYFAFWSFVSIIVGLAIINLINPDALIAQRNIKQFGIGPNSRLDTCYLSYLSDDAAKEINALFQAGNEKLKQALANGLYYSKRSNHYWNRNDWQSYNLSHQNAKQLIESYSELIEKSKNNPDGCNINPYRID